MQFHIYARAARTVAAILVLLSAMAAAPSASDATPRDRDRVTAPVASLAHWTGKPLELGAGLTRPSGSILVRAVQLRLARAGFRPGSIDGRFGPRTDAAVRSFQRHEGLAVDGVVGRRTIARFRSLASIWWLRGWDAGAVRRGSGYSQVDGSRRVREVQRHLRRLGMAPGRVDGLLGPRTDRALRRLEGRRGLVRIGVVDAVALRTLRRADRPKTSLAGARSDVLARPRTGPVLAPTPATSQPVGFDWTLMGLGTAGLLLLLAVMFGGGNFLRLVGATTAPHARNRRAALTSAIALPDVVGPVGPVEGRIQRRVVRQEPVLSGRQRAWHVVITGLWVVVVVNFWAWWLAPGHQGSLALYIPTTVALAYLTTFLPSFYWFFVRQMRRPVHMEPAPGVRVAMITLCVPSHETIDVIAGQLEALAAVRYPHDSWVLDEGADPEIRALAERYGVHYFTRSGAAFWNQAGPPFQAKTKAGNVNAWLDHVRAEGLDYDVFVQLDIDHRPSPQYLERTLGYFDDTQVAWVQSPSVCGNLSSWTARGLAEQELVLQGPLQMGFYGNSRTPFIIGSHTAYRTSAIRGIGGFQPTRAEDHLDTVVLAAAGHTGVYVPEIIATGDGPTDFGTYLGQQFAWAYSMVQIFLQHTPRLVRHYTGRQAFQFLMAQSWYTLWSLSLATLWILPIVALLSDRPIADVTLSTFLLYHVPVLIVSTFLWWWTRRWFQPQGIGLTWRGVVLEIARWPVVLWAVVNVVLRIKRPYMITPKGARADALAPGRRLYGPYVALAVVGNLAVAVFHVAIGHGEAQGYLALVLFNVAMVLALLAATMSLELSELRRQTGGLRVALRMRAATLGVIGGTVLWTAGSLAIAWAPLAEAIR